MSLYGMMRTGVSGMNAQSNRLGTVADNIANSGTTGYKRAYAEFSSLILPGEQGTYSSGAVKTTVRNAISAQGILQATSSTTDLAINGDGFFVVQDASGSPFLTRGGSFVPDGQGRLVNAAGFHLMGYSYATGEPAAVANGFNGMQVVSIADYELVAAPSTEGIFTANLPADGEIIPAGSRPSDNALASRYNHKTSLVLYDNLGAERLVDVYFTKTSDNNWEVDIYDQSAATPGTGFPYSAPPLNAPGLELEFDPTTGRLTDDSDFSMQFQVQNGRPFTLDLSGMTQFASDYSYQPPEINGSAPSAIEEVRISSDGIVSALYKNGATANLYRIPLASVQSPDQLSVLPGNVYQQSAHSGDIRIGFPNQGNLGEVVSGMLEGSNVDIAEELTNMIESQRNYTANSKVFQTGADLLDVLVNLKR